MTRRSFLFPAADIRARALGEVHSRPYTLVSLPRVIFQLAFLTEANFEADRAILAEMSLGQGVAVVPSSVVGHVALPNVVYRPIQGSEASSWLSLIHRRFEKAPAVARFIQLAKAAGRT